MEPAPPSSEGRSLLCKTDIQYKKYFVIGLCIYFHTRKHELNCLYLLAILFFISSILLATSTQEKEDLFGFFSKESKGTHVSQVGLWSCDNFVKSYDHMSEIYICRCGHVI